MFIKFGMMIKSSRSEKGKHDPLDIESNALKPGEELPDIARLGNDVCVMGVCHIGSSSGIGMMLLRE